MRRTKKKKAPSLAEQIETLKPKVDTDLDRLAAERRPDGVPAGWLRLNWLAKYGNNIFEAYLGAVREGK